MQGMPRGLCRVPRRGDLPFLPAWILPLQEHMQGVPQGRPQVQPVHSAKGLPAARVLGVRACSRVCSLGGGHLWHQHRRSPRCWRRDSRRSLASCLQKERVSGSRVYTAVVNAYQSGSWIYSCVFYSNKMLKSCIV